MVTPEELPPGVTLRPHIYDGIQEYDQRLPNWWLWTLYAAIVITGLYWFSWYTSTVMKSDTERLATELNRIENVRLSNLGNLTDESLWEKSRDPQWVKAGEATYLVKCVACHLPNLKGKEEGGAGESLADHYWMYGHQPKDVFKIVYEGSPNKASGMQSWMAELGPRRVIEVVSYVLSHHAPEQMFDKPATPAQTP